MRYTVVHEVPGRMRIRLDGAVRAEDVDPLSKVLLEFPAIAKATVYPRIGSVAVLYGSQDADAARGRILDFLDALDAARLDAVRSDYTHALATRTHGGTSCSPQPSRSPRATLPRRPQASWSTTPARLSSQDRCPCSPQ